MWKSISVKDMYEKFYSSERKGDFWITQELDKSRDIHVYDDEHTLKINVFNLECLENVLCHDDYETTSLIAGIRNGTEIYYLGTVFENEEDERIRQYFFRDNAPSGFNYGCISGPGWPLNMNRLVTENNAQCFDELKKFRPDAKLSLDKCISLLSKPGQEYNSNDFSVKLKLNFANARK